MAFYRESLIEKDPVKDEYLKTINRFIIENLERIYKYNGDIKQFKKNNFKSYKVIINEDYPTDSMKAFKRLIVILEKDCTKAGAFMNSAMVNDFLKPLMKGHTRNDDAVDWENYIKKLDSEKEFVDTSNWKRALACYMKSPTDCPIGLDFKEIISTLVQYNPVDKKYQLKDIANGNTKIQLREAVDKQVDVMLNKTIFQEHFEKVEPENDLD